MDATAFAQALEAALPGVHVEPASSVDLHVTAYIGRDDVPAVMRALKELPEFAFGFLADLTVVDLSPREPRFELVYILVSIERRQRARLKVRLQGEDARVQTVCAVWPAANWLEREAWDLFGIVFDGHPDPRRLLMPEDWEGFPLRKDYPVQIRMVPRTAEAMQVTQEEFRANLEKDRLSRR
jgi:NADH-quinone oxidoreductase subunit C